MKLQHIRVWQSYSILNKMYADSTSGKLRYAVKKNARQMAEAHEDIMEWLRGDSADHGWSLDTVPFTDRDFLARFENYLLDTTFDFEPHRFSEDLMQYADGINGEQENMIAWLFEENATETNTEGDGAEPGESPEAETTTDQP